MKKIPPFLVFVGRLTWKLFFFGAPSILVALIVCEMTVRIFLNPSDSPNVYFEREFGLIYSPNQQGVYRKGKQIKAKYNINNFGWNSLRNYSAEKPEGIERIAVIGDSFVEAFQVDFDKSFPPLLEKSFQKTKCY